MAPSFSTNTPPIASTDRRGSYDSYDSDSYFYKTYVPLSNLPTPPLLPHSSSSSRDHIPVFDLDGDVDPNLLGPVVCLMNLIPSAVSLVDPDIHIVHSILTSATLPLPTIALAACILDSLNSRFARSWRRSFPLKDSNQLVPQDLHIDSVHPEVIILAALIISVKFLDDRESATSLYSEDWGSGKWSCEQINTTQRCIMENLGYRILPLWKKETISDALEEMEMTGRCVSRPARKSMLHVPELDLEAGRAVWSAEKQITVAKTPMAENIRRTQDVAPEAGSAFAFDRGNMSEDLVLPKRTAGKIFPMYTKLS